MLESKTPVVRQVLANGISFRASCPRHKFLRVCNIEANAQSLARCHDVTEHGRKRQDSEWSLQFLATQQAWALQLRSRDRRK